MKFRNLLDIILLGAMWGPSFLFIKLGVGELAPVTLVALRVFFGSILLLALLAMRGGSLPRSRETWIRLYVMGLFAISLPFILFAFAGGRVSSALSGIINGTTPLFTAIFAHYFIASERLTLSKIVGVFFGLVGFLILLLPLVIGGGAYGDLVGVLADAIASIFYAIGIVYGRRYLSDLPPLVGPTGMLLACSSYLVPLALLLERFYPSATFSFQGLGSATALAVLGTAIAYTLYYRILRTSGAVALSLSLYLMTVFAAILGRFVLGEKLGWTVYLAGGFILLGMMIVGETIKLSFLFKAKVDSSIEK